MLLWAFAQGFEYFLIAAMINAVFRIVYTSWTCLVVEDAPAGLEAARRAGMAAVAITGTAKRAKLAAADLVVDSLRELTVEVLTELIDANCPG